MINTAVLSEITLPQSNQQLYSQAWHSFRQKYILSSKTHSLTQIQQMAEKLNSKGSNAAGSVRQGGWGGRMEVWGFGEVKIFETVCLVYSLLHCMRLQQFGEQQFSYLRSIFLQKSDSFLKYELASLLRSRVKNCSEWKKTETDLFAKILEDQHLCSTQHAQQLDSCRWRYYSFQLFTRSRGKYFRTLQQCREKWVNYLNPQLSHAPWSIAEDIKLFSLIGQVGFKWAGIAKAFGLERTEHMVKNRFNSLLSVQRHKARKNIPAEEVSRKMLALLQDKAASGTQIQKFQISQLFNQQAAESFEQLESKLLVWQQDSAQKRSVSAAQNEEMLAEPMEGNKIEEAAQLSRDQYPNFEELPQTKPTLYQWNSFLLAMKKHSQKDKTQKKTGDSLFQQPPLSVLADQGLNILGEQGLNILGEQGLNILGEQGPSKGMKLGSDTIEVEELSALKFGLQGRQDYLGLRGRQGKSGEMLGCVQMQQDESWLLELQEKEMLEWINR